MNFDEKQLDRLITLASAAPTDPTRWRELLCALQQPVGAIGAAIFTPGLDPRGRFFAVAQGATETSMSDYFGHWSSHDAWIEATDANNLFRTAGEVGTGVEALELRTLKKTGFYNDFLKPHELEHLLVLKICDASDPSAPTTHLAFHAPPSSAGFSEQHKGILRALWPHLQRAVQSHWALERARHAAPFVEAMVDAISHPAWLVGADATIEYANAAARNALSAGRWVKTVGQRLHRLGDLDAAALRSAIDQAAMGRGRTWVAGLPVEGRLQRAVLRVVSVRDDPTFRLFWRHAHALLILELPLPHDVATRWLTTMAEHYQLTAAELRVLRGVAAGKSASAIAHEASVAMATVRTQMRALFDKTGCKRQSDLVRLASGT